MEKGGTAPAAVKTLRERLRAGATNRDPADFAEGLFTQPAFIGGQEVEKATDRPPGDAPWRREAASDGREQATREDSPPSDTFSLQHSPASLGSYRRGVAASGRSQARPRL